MSAESRTLLWLLNIAKFTEKLALCQLRERWKWQEWCICSKEENERLQVSFSFIPQNTLYGIPCVGNIHISHQLLICGTSCGLKSMSSARFFIPHSFKVLTEYKDACGRLKNVCLLTVHYPFLNLSYKFNKYAHKPQIAKDN